MGNEFAELAWRFHVNPASCENPWHYESFLRLNAIEEHLSGRGVTHICVDPDKQNIAGFITLRATSIVNSCDGVMYVQPALEIAELAVSKDYERQGVGTQLVDISIWVANKLNDSFIGIQSIVLCADKCAIGFYENPKIGFGKLEDHYDVLHDGWNNNCIPMYMNLHKL